jgi:hypothetical protein
MASVQGHVLTIVGDAESMYHRGIATTEKMGKIGENWSQKNYCDQFLVTAIVVAACQYTCRARELHNKGQGFLNKI